MIYLVQVENSEDGIYAIGTVPLGLLAVGSMLKREGYRIEIVHCTEKDYPKYISTIVRDRPLFVGFSVMTGPQTLHSAMMSEAIKREDPSIPIVWGGIHPSLLPQQCISEDYIDYLVIREGEETVVELARSLENGRSVEGILGIAYKDHGKPVFTPLRPMIENLDDDRYRIDFEVVDVPRYLRKVNFFQDAQGRNPQKVFAYKTSRGCPFSCGFCYVHEFHDRRYRWMSPERVTEDIHYLRKTYGLDGVMFYDDEFYIRKKRAFGILEGIGVPAKTDVRLDMLTEPFVARLRELGILNMLVGMESGSPRILKLMSKGLTVEEIKRGALLFAKYGIRIGYSAIIGLPTETEEEQFQTIDLLLWIQRNHPNSEFTAGPYLPYPGAPLYHMALEHGFQPPTDTKGWGSIDRWSEELRLPWVPDDRFFRIREYLKLFNYNVPALNAWARFRLSRKWFSFPLDIRVIRATHRLAEPGDTLFAKTVRRAHQTMRVQGVNAQSVVSTSN